MESSSPWARQGAPAATLPGPRTQAVPPTPGQTLPPPQNAPQWAAPPQPAPVAPARRSFNTGKIAMALAAVVVSAAVGSGTTLLWVAHDKSTASTTSSAPPVDSATLAPQFSPQEVSAAKGNLCRIFDLSVRGQEGQGGLRNQGNLNVPLTLRSVNSALAVQTAVVPAVPGDVANAARTYVKATLEATTAVMGNVDAAGVNRLVDTSNDAVNKLLDACGLPR
jgi:hypothetical protein